MRLRTVYWRLEERGTGFYKISFWTKADGSNKIFATLVSIEQRFVQQTIENETGLKNIDLVKCK